MSPTGRTPAELLGPVHRSIDSAERDGHRVRVLTIRREYDAEVADVWDALCSPERIPRWFLPVTGDLRVGGHYQLEGNAGGEILACEPPEHLSITWVFDGETSWVDAHLMTTDTGTRLRLEHAAPLSPAKWDEFGPGAVGLGWELVLRSLAEHLVTRAAVDPVEYAAWTSSPEGTAFLTACSDKWAEASVRAGEHPKRARAAADRCTAAYTETPEG